MRIEQVDDELYYILALDEKGQSIRYRLKNFTPEEVVFENESISFPNQVILRPNPENNNFTTLLQNNTPTQLNTRQQQYFQNRNQINSEQIKRTLNRVEK